MNKKIIAKDTIPLLIAFIVGILLVIPRLLPGIPQGVDSASHLSKILFMVKWNDALGHIPSWFPDWYCGTPFLLLYSPLSYFLTFAIANITKDSINAYKFIDTIFFLVTPFAVYFLARELKLSIKEASWSALIFGLTPTVIGNYIFYDRFPNIIALPIICLLLVTFVRMLSKKSTIWFATSILLLSVVILIHHLSALITIFILLLAVSTLTPSFTEFKLNLLKFLSVIFGGMALTSFWLFSFIQASSQITENPFYNRTMEFPFIKFSYALYDYLILEQGILHFILAISAIFLWVSKDFKKSTIVSALILLFLGMSIFEIGYQTYFYIQIIGQAFVIAALILLTGLVILRTRRSKYNRFNFFLTCWFVSFFWLGLGYYALPIVEIPLLQSIWRSLDVYRFWLFLSLPIAFLSGTLIEGVICKIQRNKKILILAVILILLFTGGIVKSVKLLHQDVNPHLPYTVQNSEIPTELLNYLRSQNDYGRILPIRCPMWIYMIPSFTGKNLIDGWYPQEKLLPRLLEIDDYRINDLETTENRVEVWKSLIDQNQELGIHWVIVGNSNTTLIQNLTNSTFKQDAFITHKGGNLTILKNTVPNSFVQLITETGYADYEFERPSPEIIKVEITDRLSNVKIFLREAYYIGWIAQFDNNINNVMSTREGFIITGPVPNLTKVTFEYTSPNNPYVLLSLLTIVIIFLILIYSRKDAQII
ncbi:6-pyruvoyl-tetrahydropterin synthase-related protein [[Eubacterium] cellulosolvens]